MPGNGHAGCGRRLGETHRWKHRKGAPGRPHYYLLEDAGFEVMLVNARQVKNLPGRKSDVSDSTWLAQLGAHGLVRGSFVPPEPIRELRDLTRARTMMTREGAERSSGWRSSWRMPASSCPASRATSPVYRAG